MGRAEGAALALAWRRAGREAGKLTDREQPPDHYATLERAPDATDAEIKRSYRKLMREVHPDANANDPAANRKAARAQRARTKTLGDPDRRRAYDDDTRAQQRAPLRGLGRAGRLGGHRRGARAGADGPTHVHTPLPEIEPEEIEVDMAELREHARACAARCASRTAATARSPATSRHRSRGSGGRSARYASGPGKSAEFEIEVIARKVRFPGHLARGVRHEGLDGRRAGEDHRLRAEARAGRRPRRRMPPTCRQRRRVVGGRIRASGR